MSMYLNPNIEAMTAYVPGEQPRDKAYIKLNTNENPYPPAPSVLAAMTAGEVEDLRLYSDPTARGLKERLAKLYGLEPENIYVGNGSDEVLYFLFLAYGHGGAAFPDISYGFYPVFAQVCGIPATVIPLEPDFTIDAGKYHGQNKLIVIANPNAPTGRAISLTDIEKILRTNPNHVVLIDEAYVDFGGESCVPLIHKYDNLLVVQTFSKSRSMAGARLGFAIGCRALIQDLNTIKYATNPYNVNRMTAAAGVAAFREDAYYMANCRVIAENREWTAAQLMALGFTVLPSKANFLFAASPVIGGRALYLALKERGVLVRHFDKDRIDGFIRVTVGTKEQMETFTTTVKTILEDCV